MQKTTRTVAKLGRALVSALQDPEIKQAINEGFEMAKEAAANRSFAGRTQRVVGAMTATPVMVLTEALLTYAIKGRRSPKPVGT